MKPSACKTRYETANVWKPGSGNRPGSLGSNSLPHHKITGSSSRDDLLPERAGLLSRPARETIPVRGPGLPASFATGNPVLLELRGAWLVVLQISSCMTQSCLAKRVTVPSNTGEPRWSGQPQKAGVQERRTQSGMVGPQRCSICCRVLHGGEEI